MKQYAFESFVLDEAAMKLFRNGAEVDLEPQVFDVLLLLIREQHRVVSKDEMISLLWGGRVLSDHVITRTIYQLRKVLDATRKGDSLIRTVRGKGYQFVGQLARDGRSSTTEGTTTASPGLLSLKPAAWLLAGLLLLAGVLYVTTVQDTSEVADEVPVAIDADPDRYRVLTILPIQVQPDQEELSMTLTSLLDYLTYQLVNHMNIKVVHPDSLLNSAVRLDDLYAIQQSTQSDYLLEGFVESGSSQGFKVHFLLHKTNPDGGLELFRLGAFEFNFPQTHEDLTAHYRQRQVTARSIVEIIRPGLTLESESDFETLDPQAYRLVIAAHHIARSDDCEDMRRAEQLLLEAVGRDPQFVYAYLKLFDNYYKRIWVCGDSIDYHQKGLEMAQMVDQLAPNRYKAMDMRRSTILVESNQVEEAFVHAKQASWQDPVALYDKSYALRYAGFLEQSAALIDRILQLDPYFFSEKPILHAPNTLLYLNRFADHLDLLAAPGNAYHDFYRGLNLYLNQQHQAARSILQAVVSKTPDDLFGQFSQALLSIINKEPLKARQVVDALVQQRLENRHSDGEMTYKLAQLYALSGHQEPAIRQLQLAVNQGFFPASYFRHDPAMQGLRELAEFQTIVEQATKRHRAFATRHGLQAEL